MNILPYIEIWFHKKWCVCGTNYNSSQKQIMWNIEDFDGKCYSHWYSHGRYHHTLTQVSPHASLALHTSQVINYRWWKMYYIWWKWPCLTYACSCNVLNRLSYHITLNEDSITGFCHHNMYVCVIYCKRKMLCQKKILL